MGGTQNSVVQPLPDCLTTFRCRCANDFSCLITDPDQAPGHTRIVHVDGVLVCGLCGQV